jgi:hypothetical protein
MPADLTQYFQGPANTPMVIQAKACLWCDIGSGQYVQYSPQLVEFQGQINKFVVATFDLSLSISDDTNCVITLNGQQLDATYAESDGELVVTVADGPYQGTITFEIWHGGTWMDPELNGVPDHILWIGQESSLKRRTYK